MPKAQRCISPSPSIRLYDLKEFGDELQKNIPTGERLDDNYLRLHIAVTLDNKDVLINKDTVGFRDALFKEGYFDYAMMLMAGVLIHEEFHRDRKRIALAEPFQHVTYRIYRVGPYYSLFQS